jgi:hypothetical protein
MANAMIAGKSSNLMAHHGALIRWQSEEVRMSAFGYKQTFRRSCRNVCFAPESGHCQQRSAQLSGTFKLALTSMAPQRSTGPFEIFLKIILIDHAH